MMSVLPLAAPSAAAAIRSGRRVPPFHAPGGVRIAPLLRVVWLGGMMMGAVMGGIGCSEGNGKPPADTDIDTASGETPDTDPADTDTDTASEQPLGSGCNPLGTPAQCALPFPSMHHLAKQRDGSWRVRVPDSQIPWAEKTAGMRAKMRARLEAFTGFSIATPLVALFPDAPIDPATIPSLAQISRALLADGAIQVLDRESGERFPLWAELDMHAPLDQEIPPPPHRQALLIRLAKPLQYERRYVVVITRGVRTRNGSPVASPPGFLALRDGTPSDDPALEALRADYDALFPWLQAQGILRNDIALAWEWRTLAQSETRAEVTAMVAHGKGLLPPSHTVLPFQVRCRFRPESGIQASPDCEADDSLNTHNALYLKGTFARPWYLDADRHLIPERLHSIPGDSALEWKDAAVVVQVPTSVATATEPVPVAQFGHGLLATVDRYLAPIIDENGTLAAMDVAEVIAMGTNQTGLATQDLAFATKITSEPDRLFTLRDSLSQGLADRVRAFELAYDGGPLAVHPALAGRIDATRRFYYGISLGGITGAVFMAHAPSVTAGVCHVPSAMFAHILQHSSEFSPLQELLDLYVANPADQQLLFAILQFAFDPIDPVNYIDWINGPRPGYTEPWRGSILWQASLHDANAPEFGLYALARGAGIPLMTPTPVPIEGLPTLPAPVTPGLSAISLWDAKKVPPQATNHAPADNGAHHALRCLPQLHAQIRRYFQDGAIINPCEGACRVDGIDCRTRPLR